jgi:hypothetical protein
MALFYFPFGLIFCHEEAFFWWNHVTSILTKRAARIFECQLPVFDIANKHLLGIGLSASPDAPISQSIAVASENDVSFVFCVKIVIKPEVFFCSDSQSAQIIQLWGVHFLAIDFEPQFAG